MALRMKFRKYDYEKEILPLRKMFCQLYPMTFFPPAGKIKVPLKCGIKGDLKNNHPEIPFRLLEAFLRSYTSGPKYTKAMMYGSDRIDLNGKRCGIVGKGDSAYALQRRRWQIQRQKERVNAAQSSSQVISA